jgi:PAS domain S-box-containing protein
MEDDDTDRPLPGQAREQSTISNNETTAPTPLPPTSASSQPDWSQRAASTSVLSAFLHLLDISGRILYASSSCKQITGHEPATLQGRFIAELIHRDDKALFMKEFHKAILSRKLFRLIYRFKDADGKWLVLESQGRFHAGAGLREQQGHEEGAVEVYSAAATAATATTTAPGDAEHQMFHLSALPYLSPNAALMDSFLELKTENARLRAQIAKLKRKEKKRSEVAGETV